MPELERYIGEDRDDGGDDARSRCTQVPPRQDPEGGKERGQAQRLEHADRELVGAQEEIRARIHEEDARRLEVPYRAIRRFTAQDSVGHQGVDTLVAAVAECHQVEEQHEGKEQQQGQQQLLRELRTRVRFPRGQVPAPPILQRFRRDFWV